MSGTELSINTICFDPCVVEALSVGPIETCLRFGVGVGFDYGRGMRIGRGCQRRECRSRLRMGRARHVYICVGMIGRGVVCRVEDHARFERDKGERTLAGFFGWAGVRRRLSRTAALLPKPKHFIPPFNKQAKPWRY